jgi:hypothetical protein
MKRPRTALRVAATLAASLLLAPATPATWSIVAVDTRTGEVCIAGATCLTLDLEVYLPVVRVGVGGACAQSAIDLDGSNRLRIWNGMIHGLSAEQILARLLASNGQQHRQYGIVTLIGEPVTYSGPAVNDAYYGVARTIDGVRYAIQGNVLTGIQVVTNAEETFLATSGDLAQRVLAAMEAARVFGGDGRCSCDPIHPTSCGCPPPAFQFADATGFLILARIGDQDGACDAAYGCGTGQYFCNLNVIQGPGDPDPVLVLQDQYAAWRAGRAGHTDQLRTLVQPSAQRLPADGLSNATVEVELRDIDGNPVSGNPATLSIAAAYPGAPVARIGAVQDLSGGRFRFRLRATGQSGQGRWRITVHHAAETVLLWPELVVQVDPLTQLHCGWSQVSATSGASVPLTLNLGPGYSGRPYLILASASGTVPGTSFGGIHLPLNPDDLFLTSFNSAGTGNFPGTIGNLDAVGRAHGSFVAPSGLLTPLVGRHIDWSAVVFGSPDIATDTDGFDVVP